MLRTSLRVCFVIAIMFCSSWAKAQQFSQDLMKQCLHFLNNVRWQCIDTDTLSVEDVTYVRVKSQNKWWNEKKAIYDTISHKVYFDSEIECLAIINKKPFLCIVDSLHFVDYTAFNSKNLLYIDRTPHVDSLSPRYSLVYLLTKFSGRGITVVRLWHKHDDIAVDFRFIDDPKGLKPPQLYLVDFHYE
ncbi:MAG: hypothetical protein RL660_3047 [Bacteroidota bacterium]|jgi:hypothetical protein